MHDEDILGDGLGLLGAEIHSVPMGDGLDDIVGGIADELDPKPDDEFTTLQAWLKNVCQEAKSHYEEYIEPDQAEATDYYYGRPFGDEEKGRSQVVDTALRDTVLDKMPDLLDIFISDQVVEFRPRGPEDVRMAKEKTEAVNFVFLEENEGFLIMNAVLKDTSVRRIGYTKWRTDEVERVEGERHVGLTQDEVNFLAQEEDVDQVDVLSSEVRPLPIQDPQTGEVQLVPTELLDVEVRRRIKRGRIIVESVPPEEVYWTPGARTVDGCHVWVHSRMVSREEAYALGVTEKEFDEKREAKKASNDSLSWRRTFYGIATKDVVRSDDGNHAKDEVLLSEVYAKYDLDGDDVAELRKFICLGNDFDIVGDKQGELESMIPFAAFSQDPEPHTLLGLCDWDHAKDVQRIKSQVKRAQLNSLARAVEPQLAIGQGVNIRDLISPEIVGFIRAKDVNQIREIKDTFVGDETLAVLTYYDQVLADKTGKAGPREGLDPNILQSTAEEAVENNISKSQKRTKLNAKALAETGMKRMFLGIAKLMVENPDHVGMMRLNGEWVRPDPRSWTIDHDVIVNVGLGTGSKRQRLGDLAAIAEKQEQHIQQGSPLVSFVELRATYARAQELMGYKDDGTFWRKWGPEQQQQYEQQLAQQPHSDPAMALVEVERVKTEAQIGIEDQKAKVATAKEVAKLKLEREKLRTENEREMLKIRLEDDRLRDKIARDYVLKEKEIEAKNKVDLEEARLNAEVQRDRVAQSTQE